MFENSKEIMRKIKNKEGLTDAEFTTVERCLLLGDVDDKILNYQLGVKIGVIDDLFHQDKMEFKNADKIMVLHNGEVAEIGTHSTLMSMGGLYYNLYNAQKYIDDNYSIWKEILKL